MDTMKVLRVNWCQGNGFLSVGAQMGAIKLAMAGTYLGLVVLISSIVGLLILYGFLEHAESLITK